MRGVLGTLLAVSLLWAVPVAAQGPPTVEAVLAELKVSEADRQRVLKGEFVSAVIPEVSERDLSNSFVFLVKVAPEALAKQLVEGRLTANDPQVKTFGTLRGEGSPADMSALTMSQVQAEAFAKAKRGSALNLATSEITAFNAAGGDRAAVQRTLQEVLLGRYRAYREGGLTSITPYDRGGSIITDPAGDLRKATEALTVAKKYLPAFYAMVLDYPKAIAPNARERFFWAIYDVNGTPTYVLTHVMTVTEGEARAFATRQYYVSQGYNAEQATGGFLPVQGGTMVVYAAHAFTDQVAGMGGSMKRGIGRRVMAEKLREMFEANRKRIER